MNIDEAPTEPSYSSSIIKIAVSQICQSIGFQAAEASALNTITDIATRCLQSISRSAAASANSLRRTQSNAFDITLALEELGTVQGFTGGSRTNVECVLASSLIVELERFLFFSDETPFAKPLPRRRRAGSDCVGGEKKDVVKPNHVPKWLPDMPVIGRDEEEEEEKLEEWKCCNEEEIEEIVDHKLVEQREKRGGVKERVEKGKSGGGLSRSGGFGKKRVLCKNDWKRGNDDEGIEKKRVMMSFKKRLK